MTTQPNETPVLAQGNPKKKSGLNENVKTLLIAGLLALTFRSLVFEPFHIPSGSMKDTLLIGDYLFVTKYSYGYSQYSFPFALPLFKGRVLGHAPQRGEVVVFRPPGSPHVDFIKRLVGLPGDRVQVKMGELYINDQRVPRIPAGEYDDIDPGRLPVKAQRYIESLPNGPEHHILDRGEIGMDASTGIDADNTEIYTVPEKHYFMMGDNRDNSRDSRFPDPVGFVPEENIIGPAKLILFSIGGDGAFWQIWKWPTSIRWDRFFHSIQ